MKKLTERMEKDYSRIVHAMVPNEDQNSSDDNDVLQLCSLCSSKKVSADSPGSRSAPLIVPSAATSPDACNIIFPRQLLHQ